MKFESCKFKYFNKIKRTGTSRNACIDKDLRKKIPFLIYGLKRLHIVLLTQ